LTEYVRNHITVHEMISSSGSAVTYTAA